MNSLNNTRNNSLILAFDSIDSCFGYVDYITSQIHKLITFYNAGELNKANNTFAEIVELMDLYIQLISKVYSVIRTERQGKSFKDESIQKLEIHLLSVIKALLQAKEKDDIIMLCDLLEYELVDNLTQWKIKVLPELKKLKNS
jgi:predicted transcriptional regulator